MIRGILLTLMTITAVVYYDEIARTLRPDLTKKERLSLVFKGIFVFVSIASFVTIYHMGDPR